MRTTVTIDDDVLAAARARARAERRSLGQVLSDLARRGLAPVRPDHDDDLPVFHVPPDATPLTGDMVAAALEDA